MEKTYFLLGEFLGKTPRRCTLIRDVQIVGYEPPRKCWVATAYPPIAGRAPDSLVLLHLLNLKASLADIETGGEMVEVYLPRIEVVGDTIDRTEVIKLNVGSLASPKNVSKRAFPFGDEMVKGMGDM